MNQVKLRKVRDFKKEWIEIADKELTLNIEHQFPKGIEPFTQFGYQFDNRKYIFFVTIPNIFKK